MNLLYAEDVEAGDEEDGHVLRVGSVERILLGTIGLIYNMKAQIHILHLPGPKITAPKYLYNAIPS